MPRTPATGAVADSQRQSGLMPDVVVDIELSDNATRYYWSMMGGYYPVKLGPGDSNGKAKYQPFVKSFGTYKFSRSLRTDAGDLKIQNISGNSIVRDVANVLSLGEFDGALCVVRLWRQLVDAADMEVHGKLSEPVPAETEVAFRMLQLFDPSQQSIPKRGPSVNCTLRYLSAQCGSTSINPTCGLTFADCTANTAVERFNGLPFTVKPKLVSIRREPRDPNLNRGRRGIQF